MKKIENISEGPGYNAVNVGTMESIEHYSLIHHKTKTERKGKVFLKDATNATATEISFNSIPPRTEVPYFHKHLLNEETYIILSGSGDFQVDDDCFPIKEGAVVRVAPSHPRGLRNSGDTPMLYIVIQAMVDSLGDYSSEDGEITPFTPRWK